MSDPHNQAPQKISAPEPKTPAERVRQIQEMQRAMETQAAPRQSAPAAPVPSQSAVQTKNDGFAVNKAQLVKDLGAPRADAASQLAFAKAQKTPEALFGGKTDHELVGVPWKVIDFNASLPALFELPKSAGEYDAKLPEQAVQLDAGLLFTAKLEPKNKDEKPLAKAVLVSAEGQLLGAECKDLKSLERLIAKSPSLPLASSIGPGAKWKVADGMSSRFEVQIERAGGKRELLLVNNFGLDVTRAPNPKTADIVVANYFRDQFE